MYKIRQVKKDLKYLSPSFSSDQLWKENSDTIPLRMFNYFAREILLRTSVFSKEHSKKPLEKKREPAKITVHLLLKWFHIAGVVIYSKELSSPKYQQDWGWEIVF